MRKRCHRTIHSVAILASLVVLLAAGGCSKFRALLGRRTPPPAAAEAVVSVPAGVRPAGESADAHYRLGRHYAERSRHHEAAREFRTAIEIDPANAKAWNGLGVCFDALGRFDDAMVAYREALRLDPGSDYLHNNLGYSHLLRGDREAAKEEFGKALELNPANTVTRANLEKLSATETAATIPPAPAALPTPVAALEPAPNLSPATAAPPTALPTRVAAAVPADGLLVSLAPDPARPKSVRVRVVSAGDLRRQCRVELTNASGTPKLLGEVAAFLSTQGYPVDPGQAPPPQKRDKTVILYRDGALQPAYLVAQAFPGYQEMKKTADFGSPEASVRVLLGRDLESHRKSFAADAKKQ